MSSCMPNFLVVGSTKSGTTSLYNYLQQHPKIYLNSDVKESNFFIEPKSVLGCGPRYFGEDSYGKSIKEYSKLFEGVDRTLHSSIGEVCTTYIHFSENAIPNIKKYLGNPKIIIILRNPIDRAYSYHMHNIRDGDEVYSFEEALEMEESRKINNLWLSFRLKELGNYSTHVENYFNNFTDVKVILFEDMRKNMEKTMDDIFNFLELNNVHVNVSQKYNVSGVPKNQLLHNITHGNVLLGKIILRTCRKLLGQKITKLCQNKIDAKNLVKSKIDEKTKVYLEGYYYDEVKKLSKLLNIDLNKKWGINND